MDHKVSRNDDRSGTLKPIFLSKETAPLFGSRPQWFESYHLKWKLLESKL